MRETKNTDFIKGTLALSISVIITKILGVAFKVPLSYVLGDEGMGYFNTAYAIYGFFYILCTAGVPKSVTLVLTSYRTEKSDCDREVLRSGLALFALIGLFSTLLNIICAPVLARVVGNNSAVLSIVFVAPSIFFVSLSGVLRGYLNSSEKLTVIATSQLIEAGIKLVLGLIFALFGVRAGASVSTISALAILGITLGCAMSFIYMIISVIIDKKNVKPRQNNKIERKNIQRKILKNALPIALSSSLLNLSSTLDLVIIIKRLVHNGMSESHANAIYGNYTTLAVPMFNLVIAVLSPIAVSYMPRLSLFDFEGKKKEFSSALNKLLLITLLISVPASLSFYFYSFDLLDVLFSLHSSAQGADMLIAISLGVCFLSALTVINTALESQHKISATVISLLVGCALKLAVSYTLIGNSTLGILGAPVGTVISYAVSLAISLLFLERGGVRTHAVFKICLLYSVGLAAFYPPYHLIYSTAICNSSFGSMCLSLFVSFFAYILLVLLLYFVCKCLKCTKKLLSD